MEVRIYTTGNILEFVSSDQFSKLKHIPITKHRALSYANNPRSASSDEILFVAFENDEVIGYLGALPDKIFYQGEWKRMAWLSCIWVDPRFRGKNIAGQLIDLTLKEWDYTTMMTNMTPGVLKNYERTGHFNAQVIRSGIRGYLRFNLVEVLPPKGGIFARIKLPLQILDFILNIINAIRLVFYPGYKMDPAISYEYIEKISPEAEELINDVNRSSLLKRGRLELEWITGYPWILEDKENPESKRYYFSSVSRLFFYQQVEFRDENNRVSAFLMLSIRDNHLTVPYVFFSSGMESSLVKFLFNTMLDYQLNMLTVFHPELAKKIKEMPSPFLFRKKILRPYFIPKTLDLPDPAFQDGDGDGVFT
jgi:GNAT superfamily N-acetyltransferase